MNEPSENASKFLLGYGAHNVMMVTVCTIWFEMNHSQRLSVSVDDWKPLLYLSCTPLATTSSSLDAEACCDISFFARRKRAIFEKR